MTSTNARIKQLELELAALRKSYNPKQLDECPWTDEVVAAGIPLRTPDTSHPRDLDDLNMHEFGEFRKRFKWADGKAHERVTALDNTIHTQTVPMYDNVQEGVRITVYDWETNWDEVAVNRVGVDPLDIGKPQKAKRTDSTIQVTMPADADMREYLSEKFGITLGRDLSIPNNISSGYTPRDVPNDWTPQQGPSSAYPVGRTDCS